MEHRRRRPFGALGAGVALAIVTGIAAGCGGPRDRGDTADVASGDRPELERATAPSGSADRDVLPTADGSSTGEQTGDPSGSPAAAHAPAGTTPAGPTGPGIGTWTGHGADSPGPDPSAGTPAVLSTTEVDALLAELDRLFSQLDGEMSAADAAVANPGE